MNTIGMLQRHAGTSNAAQEASLEQSPGEDDPVFHSLLKRELPQSDSELEMIMLPNAEDIPLKKPDLRQLLHHLLTGFEQTRGKTAGSLAGRNHEEEAIPSDIFTGKIAEDDLPENLPANLLLQIRKDAVTILSNIDGEQALKNASSKLALLLEQWTVLEKKSGNSDRLPDLLQESGDDKVKEQGIWRELLQAFKSRQQFAQRNVYHADAKVISTDVARWISNKLSKDIPAAEHGLMQNLHHNMPMSRIHQHVIYINQTHSTAEQQFMEQFQQAMKSSRFSMSPNGTNQLLITLRPDHLGEMTIRFAEVDGEMTVRIMVTSEAAKHMLQSNIHQLKHMFTPHQVSIERQDTAESILEMPEDQSGQPMEDEEQGHAREHEKEKNNESREDDSETAFHQLLMNEKV